MDSDPVVWVPQIVMTAKVGDAYQGTQKKLGDLQAQEERDPIFRSNAVPGARPDRRPRVTRISERGKIKRLRYPPNVG